MKLFKAVRELEVQMETQPINLQDDTIGIIEKFISIIPIIIPVLRFLKIFTGKKVDDKIDEIILWFDTLLEDEKN